MRGAPERVQSGPKINDAIRADEVRLIDENGQNQGIVSKSDALARAEETGLDLVEISPDAEPPVCKILDFGKHIALKRWLDLVPQGFALFGRRASWPRSSDPRHERNRSRRPSGRERPGPCSPLARRCG